MTLNSSSTDNILSTTNAAVHKNLSDTIEKKISKKSKKYQYSIVNFDVDDGAQSFEIPRK